MMGAEISDDGKYAVLTISFGCEAVNRLYVLPLGDDLGLPPSVGFCEAIGVVENFDAEYDYVCNEGTVFTFKTNHKAPRSKVGFLLLLLSFPLLADCHSLQGGSSGP